MAPLLELKRTRVMQGDKWQKERTLETRSYGQTTRTIVIFYHSESRNETKTESATGTSS